MGKDPCGPIWARPGISLWACVLGRRPARPEPCPCMRGFLRPCGAVRARGGQNRWLCGVRMGPGGRGSCVGVRPVRDQARACGAACARVGPSVPGAVPWLPAGARLQIPRQRQIARKQLLTAGVLVFVVVHNLNPMVCSVLFPDAFCLLSRGRVQ